MHYNRNYEYKNIKMILMQTSILVLNEFCSDYVNTGNTGIILIILYNMTSWQNNSTIPTITDNSWSSSFLAFK